MTKTVSELAAEAFDAWKYHEAQQMRGMPTSYEDQKKAFIELAEAREEAVKRQRALDEAIGD